MKHSYSDEDLKKAIAKSVSKKQVLEELNIKPAGGNYATLRRKIKELDLDISHFSGRLWSKGKVLGPVRPLSDYLVENSYTLSHKLKLRLINEGIFERKCYNCNLKDWMGKPIPIELEHINGIHSDNRLENLTILCPNCHAQTDTYRGKNIGKSTKE